MNAEEKLMEKIEEMFDEFVNTHSREEVVALEKKINEIANRAERRKAAEIEKERIKNIPPVDRTKQCLTDGSPVTPDHRELKANGQQKGYVVLCEEERKKGFVRPVRKSYIHIGIRPKYPLRDLTAEEKERYADFKYIKFEEYPESESPVTGRFWTQKDLNSGCGGLTTMGLSLAETYARDPKFYGGTFCCHCGMHFDVAEFIWAGTTEQVGS